MPGFHTAALTVLAMLAFAANSLLCRLALQSHAIDAASFTAVRLVSGALVLALVVRLRAPSGAVVGSGRWGSAAWLFVYAAAFSLAYLQLPAGVGALLLFGAVQATMVGVGLWRGERLALRQWAGLVLALGGLVVLLRPGLSAPPWGAAGLMLLAGVAWGAYSLRGKGAKDPVGVTAGNFLRAAPLALLMWGGGGGPGLCQRGGAGLCAVLWRADVRIGLCGLVCGAAAVEGGHGGVGAAERAAAGGHRGRVAAGRKLDAAVVAGGGGHPGWDCAGGAGAAWAAACGARCARAPALSACRRAGDVVAQSDWGRGANLAGGWWCPGFIKKCSLQRWPDQR